MSDRLKSHSWLTTNRMRNRFDWSLLTAAVLVQTVLIEEFILGVGGLVEKLLHGDLAKGKGFPVTRVLWMVMEVVFLEFLVYFMDLSQLID